MTNVRDVVLDAIRELDEMIELASDAGLPRLVFSLRRAKAEAERRLAELDRRPS